MQLYGNVEGFVLLRVHVFRWQSNAQRVHMEQGMGEFSWVQFFGVCGLSTTYSSWWFQTFFMFHPYLGK